MFRSLVLSCLLAPLFCSNLAFGESTGDTKGSSKCFMAPSNQTIELADAAMKTCLTKLKLSESDLHGNEKDDDKVSFINICSSLVLFILNENF